MKIILTPKEAEEYFHTAMCNGLGMLTLYGLEVSFSSITYKKAKSNLKEPCYEDVLLEMLKIGGWLDLVDVEGGEDTRRITLNEVHERVEKTPAKHLMEYVNDTGGDATTADVILQTVFLGEVIYG